MNKIKAILFDFDGVLSNDRFDAIISSAKYGLLKHDENGKLFDIAMKELNSTPEKTLVIDDSIDLKPIIESKGASFYHYLRFM